MATNENTKLVGLLKKEIDELKDKLKEYQDIIDNFEDKADVKKLINTNINMVNVNNGESINFEKTNIHCWWCSESFDNIPCYLPEKIENNVYYVSGCFCMQELQ